MRTLVIALYAEGVTDNRFLPPLIQRTAERILAQYGYDFTDVLDPIIVPKQQGRRQDCILKAAHFAYGYHILIVHSDADDNTQEPARLERIQPGFALVAHSNESVCKHLVPIIPVRMIEAWMLADHSAFRETIGTDISPQNLGFPARPALVETDANPKQTLNEIIRKAQAGRSQRHRSFDFSTRQESLARRIGLDILLTIPSYKTFVLDFKKILAQLNFISLDHREEIS